jgi:hypothetical protein
MRVYLPSTLPRLAEDLRTGQVAADMAYAVTAALREAYASGDTEELEYVALLAAARASLALLAAEIAKDPQAPPRRVVLAAEIPDDTVSKPGGHSHPAAVAMTAPVPIVLLVSAHIDDPEAIEDIKNAAAALPAADAGDEDAEFTVDQAEGHELAWYASQELPDLV